MSGDDAIMSLKGEKMEEKETSRDLSSGRNMKENREGMQGKSCLITGGNSGIGKATALSLAAMDASIILVCRDKQRGETAQKDIIQETGNSNVDLLVADLSVQHSIRTLVEEITSSYQLLDVLINNAGVHHLRRQETSDGYEANFAVNYLAPFLLTNLLLDHLKASAPSRIINVSSRLIHQATLEFDDLQHRRDYPILKTGSLAYCQSKLALTLFTYELAKRLQGSRVTVNCYCPGWTRTGLMEGELRPLSHRLMSKVFAKRPEVGARTGVFLASSATVKAISGRFFEDCKEKPEFQSCYKPSVSQRLWSVSEDLTHLHG